MSLFVQLELLRYRIACQASTDAAKADIESHAKPLRMLPRHDKMRSLLAAARLTRRRRGAKAEVYVVAWISNTLIAIFGTP